MVGSAVISLVNAGLEGFGRQDCFGALKTLVDEAKPILQTNRTEEVYQ